MTASAPRAILPRLAAFLILLAAPCLAPSGRAQDASMAPAVSDPIMGSPVTGYPVPTPQGSVVTAWTLAADRLGRGGANWRTLAIMHVAMHDALNAAESRYARWRPPGPGEPPGEGAAPLLAMATAAHRVILARHPDAGADVTDRLYAAALAAERPGPRAAAAIRLGEAVAAAKLALHVVDAAPAAAFPVGTAAGAWRPTPVRFLNPVITREAPFMPVPPEAVGGRPPHPLGSARYHAELEEVRAIGGADSTTRSPQQAVAVRFWADHAPQRGWLHLGVALMAAEPPPGGPWEEARAMAALTVSLADSAILAWQNKRAQGFWRPVTALNEGSPGMPVQPGWTPLIETPPHPDHPSGHATDCSAAATVIAAVFGRDIGPVPYAAVGGRGTPVRSYARVSQAAAECAASRAWGGVHFRHANEEGARLGAEIARRALDTVPALGAAAGEVAERR